MCSVAGGMASQLVDREIPSQLIPFCGEFPLLDMIEARRFREAICSTMWIEDLPPKFLYAAEMCIRDSLVGGLHERTPQFDGPGQELPAETLAETEIVFGREMAGVGRGADDEAVTADDLLRRGDVYKRQTFGHFNVTGISTSSFVLH